MPCSNGFKLMTPLGAGAGAGAGAGGTRHAAMQRRGAAAATASRSRLSPSPSCTIAGSSASTSKELIAQLAPWLRGAEIQATEQAARAIAGLPNPPHLRDVLPPADAVQVITVSSSASASASALASSSSSSSSVVGMVGIKSGSGVGLRLGKSEASTASASAAAVVVGAVCRDEGGKGSDSDDAKTMKDRLTASRLANRIIDLRSEASSLADDVSRRSDTLMQLEGELAVMVGGEGRLIT